MIIIGRPDTRYSIEFRLNVTTPEGLRAVSVSQESPILGHRATLVVSSIDSDEIRRCNEDILTRCEMPTLTESVSLLQRYFVEEYENYKNR